MNTPTIELNGKKKAAVLLIALGPEASANVLKHLPEREIEQLTMEIYRMETVADEQRHEVLREFHEMGVASAFVRTGGSSYAQEVLSLALGSDRAAEILTRMATTLRPHHFDFVRETDPEQLAGFIQDEPPQAIALVLSHLHPTMASRVLAGLPGEMQAEVAQRIATMERTPPEVIESVESVLRRRLANVITSDYSTVGGVEYLVKVLTNVDRSTERVILDDLKGRDPQLADEVMRQMFVFENLIQLDDAALQRVLRDVDPRELARALRGASDELRDRIFGNLSSRAAEMLREDMEVSGPIRRRQVEEAQQIIVTAVRRLEEAGVITIQRGNDDALI